MYYLPRLKEIRLLRNMKQKDVCELLNMKQSQYSRYESGEDEMKIGTFIEICEALNVSADYLLGLTDDDPFLRQRNNDLLTPENQRFLHKLENLLLLDQQRQTKK